MNLRPVPAPLLVCLLAVVASAPGCRPDDQRTQTISADDVRAARARLAPEVVEHLDAGNGAYRAARESAVAGDSARADSLYRAALRSYRAALRSYRDAARVDDGVAAAWFGIYMTEAALGNADAADEAMRRARSAAPGATLMDPEEEDEP